MVYNVSVTMEIPDVHLMVSDVFSGRVSTIKKLITVLKNNSWNIND